MTGDDKRENPKHRIRSDIDLASFIDAAVLKTETSVGDIEVLCRQAIQYHYKAVFVNPAYVRLSSQLLQGSGVRVGTVSGFPLGATLTDAKVYEAELGENNGAHEIDMVANIGAIKSGDYDLVATDITRVRQGLSSQTILKVIIESSLLSHVEKITAARIVADSGADFVKTSTGMFAQASIEDVTLLYETVGKRIGVKASGGIRTLAQALAMIEAGASRIGTSAGVQIIEELRSRK